MMRIDKEEHKELLVAVMAQTNFPGKMVRVAAELMDIIEKAEIGNGQGNDTQRGESGAIRD